MKATHNPPTDVQVTPADLLRMAARYIQRHGWTQGDYYTTGTGTPTPAACAVGAIGMAVHGTALPAPEHVDTPEGTEVIRARNALYTFLDLDWHIVCDDNGDPVTDPTVAEWNDDPDRTADEVITALNRAADRWDRLNTQEGGDR